MMKKRRADKALFEDLNLESIELARALIMAGRVMAGDRKILRASEFLKPNDQLRVKGELNAYVSRGAHKLKKALEVFNISLEGKTCVDVGASTGGFTDVMLRAGAGRVYSVDVGYNLLDYKLRSDPKVVCMERTNARFLKPEDFDPRPVFGATDVSFISLKAVLPAALSVLEGDEKRFVALIKPQFEAEKEEVGEKGVVRDRHVHEKVLRDILGFIPTMGWRVNGLDFSPIRGPEGNIEFLLDLVPGENEATFQMDELIDVTISRTYDFFSKSIKEGL
ncbi:MAG: TlyA family RNA methyltransferase [Clostridiales bacterium]|nr:TlyA family RNA methyltransferase [Clostridiales bacterium]